MRLLTNLRRAVIALVLVGVAFTSQSCDFLDVVPDNVSTMDHAFELRNEAEKYLFTLYSYLPRNGDTQYNMGFLGGDELWIPYKTSIDNVFSFEIARGNQRVGDSYYNSWVGNYDGGGPGDNYQLFDGIRHCNIFLENIRDENQVPDLDDLERERWIGEAEFLKAYFHFQLMRMYGPIPLIKDDLPVDASEEQVQRPRQPVDEVVDYIVELLDSAAQKLPNRISDRNTELGRITSSIALGVKAKVLLTAASPLFNGNEGYPASFATDDGTPLINPTFEVEKWEAAAAAADSAIQVAEANGHELFEFEETAFDLSDTTITKLSIRQAVSERWNPEVIWGLSNSTTWDLQRNAMVPLDPEHNHNNARKIFSAPIKIARMFYSENGVPMDEDKTLTYSRDNESELRTADASESYNIEEGFETARLNFDREYRFYANLGFDGSTFYKYDSPSNSDENTWVIRAKFGDYSGSSHSFHNNVTGYYIKKLVDWNQTTSSSGVSYKEYAWPQLRLADLYLMYAEAMNEAYGPSAEVYEYLDRIRARAGLDGVVESWKNYSVNPDKPNTQEGLREIIQRERMVELSFEGKRFWDLRRWKRAADELNNPITGWNVKGQNAVSYYQKTTVYQQTFVAPRDYLWPIDQTTMIRNPALIQNPGW
ncbi:RagB/SusD family nutrient uptake outer membrane protein [Aliifodinibius sp. S!AR15-10]|uniref:RagB/SusD family nutrient uptake outer membrane protein n=1 Tax=Aliifodinibius sp. S!AR15-10 TaxID=2950437 RepID=UPI0028622A69|nr:RagB/SusD family nutrient uptake outer membrane protein [Aliifodinibius sp. S!AR15-10]MDR8392778.1 RagB/SusD family nutrient uptake outer membrane protein [Aliifodinibius sp. S!AR15-10]